MNREETLRWIDRLPPSPTELVGEDIVFLSHQRWDAHFTPVHGTTLRLAQRNRVLFIEPPDSFTWLRHDANARAAMLGAWQPFERFNENFTIYHTPPLFLPCQAHSRLVRGWLNVMYRRVILKAMHRMGMTRPLLWVFQFNAADVVDRVGAKGVVYECPEEAAEFARGDRLRRYVSDMDLRMCRRADAVIVANPHMLRSRERVSRDIMMYPWPADIEHYGQAMNPDVVPPADIASIPHPIVGFHGMIDPCRFDVDMLLEIARRRPAWSFVLIGGVLGGYDPKPLNDLPNVHRLGMKPVSQLPSYVNAFDVGIIPYVVNGFTRSITPLKFGEYLAAGKPIVTTNLPAVELYDGALLVADTTDEFEACIEQAIHHNTAAAREKRLAVVRKHDWDHYMLAKTGIAARILERESGVVSSGDARKR